LYFCAYLATLPALVFYILKRKGRKITRRNVRKRQEKAKLRLAKHIQNATTEICCDTIMKSYLSSFQLKKNCACESKSLAKGGKNQEGNNPLSSLEGTDIAPPCHRVPVETSFPSLILMIKVI
jgi:hypothetical protein